MKKKTIAILTVVLLMAVFFVGCGKKTAKSAYDVSENAEAEASDTQEKEASQKPEDTPSLASEVHVGYVYSGVDCESVLIKEAVEGLVAISSTPLFPTVIDADEMGYDLWSAQIKSAGCDIVFLYGIEKQEAQLVAQTYPEIKFELYGVNDEFNEKNLNRFYFRIYQQQYLNGMAAAFTSSSGSIGYISTEAESRDVRRVNAFALGAMAANPQAIVHFIWTGGAYDDDSSAAKELGAEGCDVIFKAHIDDKTLEYSKSKGIKLIGGCEDEYVYKALHADALSYIVERARASISIRTQPKREDYWIGIEEYEPSFIEYDFLSEEQLDFVKAEAKKISDGNWDVFIGPITDIYGNTIIPEGVEIPDEDLLYMLWYVQNIKALSPPMG